METIGQQVEQLLDDVKRVSTLLEDAAADAELLDAQPYQQARVIALRRHMFDMDVRLQHLQSELAKAKRMSPPSFQAVEQYSLNIA